MKFTSLNGRPRTLKNSKKYLIDWDGKTRSKFQSRVKAFLRDTWQHDIVFEEFPIVGTRLSLDIYNANLKIAIEVQGAQHTKFIKFFHEDRLKFLGQLQRDDKKLDFCNLNRIQLVEIYPNDILDKDFFEKHEIYL